MRILKEATMASTRTTCLTVAIGLVGLLGACSQDYSGSVPDNAYCNPVDNWPAERVEWEARIFELINHARSLGANCTPSEHFPPTHEYEPHPALTCAARNHSMDMHDRDYFDHTNPEGEGATDRASLAGYNNDWVGENIVAGYGSPEGQFEGWMSSPGHCRAIMNPDHYRIGLGTFLGGATYGQYTTANFGAR
jgi:uncharacterized protein YkwD